MIGDLGALSDSPAVLVGVGGAAGALCRYAVTATLDTETFPYGTFAVNVLGSFVLGAVFFSGVATGWLLLAGTGFCGSFTTFSSFAFDTVTLAETGRLRRSVANAAGTLVAALGALGLAWLLVT